MQPSTIWSEWDRTQPGSLKRRHDAQESVLPGDLVLILESLPDCVPDALLRDYLLRALRGELHKPRGRPVSKLPNYMLASADVWIKDLAEDIRAERNGRPVKRLRGELEPTRAAADVIAKLFKNITGRHLLNQISKMKNAAI